MFWYQNHLLDTTIPLLMYMLWTPLSSKSQGRKMTFRNEGISANTISLRVHQKSNILGEWDYHGKFIAVSAGENSGKIFLNSVSEKQHLDDEQHSAKNLIKFHRILICTDVMNFPRSYVWIHVKHSLSTFLKIFRGKNILSTMWIWAWKASWLYTWQQMTIWERKRV